MAALPIRKPRSFSVGRPKNNVSSKQRIFKTTHLQNNASSKQRIFKTTSLRDGHVRTRRIGVKSRRPATGAYAPAHAW
jgi:hypothetical protein